MKIYNIKIRAKDNGEVDITGLEDMGYHVARQVQIAVNNKVHTTQKQIENDRVKGVN